jgi:hypothetical protein
LNDKVRQLCIQLELELDWCNAEELANAAAKGVYGK